MCPVLTHSLAGSLKINSVVENHTISGDDYMPAYLEHLFAGEHPAKYREHGSALRHQELMNLRLRGHAGGHRLLDARRGMTEIRELGSRPAGPGLAGRVGYRSAVNQPPGQEVDADLFRRLARVEQELPAKQLGSRWYREHRGEFLVGGRMRTTVPPPRRVSTMPSIRSSATACLITISDTPCVRHSSAMVGSRDPGG